MCDMASLPALPAWSGPLPTAAAPTDMAIYQLPTGTYETRAGFAVKGGSFRDKRQFAATAVLVQHPRGDLLIDAGFGARVAEHIAMLPRMVRAPFRASRTAREQLDASGYDRNRLLGVVVTHCHWDHVSGLPDLGAPVWINAEEQRYAAKDTDGAVFRSLLPELSLHEYTLDGPAYLGFPASFDVHGDGSVVVVLAGGHTPGSVAVFVTMPTGARYGFIADLTWQLDGIRRRAERPWLLRKLADSDPEQVRLGLARAIALSDVITVIPAHDLHAYDAIPLLPAHIPADSANSTSSASPASPAPER